MVATRPESDLKALGQTLLTIGTLLMSAGANSRRIRKTLERIAAAFDCNVELLITHRALMITVNDDEVEHFHSGLKRTSPHGVNFRVVSGISRMSWRVVQENWSIDQINEEVQRLLALPQYPRLVILLLVSLAGAAFCRLFEGSYADMLVAFSATFVGMIVRQLAIKKAFNPYLGIFAAAFTSSMIASAGIQLSGVIQEPALTAAVLYLIPGVPLINSFSDLLHGNIMNGIVRGAHGLMIAFSIAVGLMLALKISQLMVL